jgi:rRNA maturation protein Nop10
MTVEYWVLSKCVGWAKWPDANASDGVPTINPCVRHDDGGHGARAPLPTLRFAPDGHDLGFTIPGRYDLANRFPEQRARQRRGV